jgi:hypothetical protein
VDVFALIDHLLRNGERDNSVVYLQCNARIPRITISICTHFTDYDLVMHAFHEMQSRYGEGKEGGE